MAKYNTQNLNQIFYALSDPTRRDIVQRLSGHSLAATQIAEHYRISFPAVSKHLKILEKADLVKRTRAGRQHSFRLRVEKLEQVNAWLKHWSGFWNSRLDSLEKYLAQGK